MTVSKLLLVSVGNSRTRIARASADFDASAAIEPSRVVENADMAALAAGVVEVAGGLDPQETRVLVASVNEPLAEKLVDELSARGVARIQRVYSEVPAGRGGLAVPMKHDLTPPVTVGVDRLLAALAAYARTGTACVVIDAGTAVTVDFVDDAGLFRGGVIAPGLTASLAALHRQTAALPAVEAPRSKAALPAGPLGRTTRDAMLLGCVEGIRGLVHRMIDLYAATNNRYPRVVATGGDAPLLFENDDLVEHIVPDLILLGMQATWSRSAAARA